MWHVKVLATGCGMVLAMSMALAPGASAGNPCKAVKGVSPCVFGIQLTPEGEPEPLHIGQSMQEEWWGRGSYFNAGRYSYLCHEVIFGGTVAAFPGGSPMFATPTTSFVGAGTGGACTSTMGAVQVSADSSHWEVQLSVKESTSVPGQFLINDQLKTSTKEPIDITAVYAEEGLSAVVCTWTAPSVRGTAPWVAKEQITGKTVSGAFKLDKEASNSPQCPASGKLETNWRYTAAPPAGGQLPMVLAIG